jgi:hypothetical protein
MAEPLEYLAIGEAIVLAGESLGLIGTAAEITEGALIAESAIGASSVVGLDTAASAALAASEIGTTEAIVGTGMALGASEVAASTAGAATFDSMFASAAAEVALESGPEVVAQGASWAERAGSLASKAGTVGAAGVSVAKASPYILTGGDVASRVMSGEGVEEAIVNTAGDLTKIGAKAVGWSLEQFLNDIDPSVLIVGGLAAYFYFSN